MDNKVDKFNFLKSENDLLAINEEKLKTMILEIYEYRDKISKILEDAEILVDSTKSFYDSDDGKKFRNRFKEYSTTFSTFLSNIKSYGEDFEYVLSSYKETTLKNVDIYREK